MSYNGSGLFQINTSGQPVVAGTVITASAFNALTADLATGLTTAITKDGQTATTAQIPFAQGLRSTLVTDSTTSTSGSIITDGGLGVAKAITAGTTITGTKLIPTGTSVTGNGMYLPATNSVGISTAGVNAVYIDASQNVGVGVTPSAWRTNDKAIQVGGSTDYSNIVGAGAGITFGNNFYRDSGGFKYKNSYAAGRFDFDYTASGGFSWNIAASGTAGNAITFTQAMTLDASANLLVGTTSNGNAVRFKVAANGTQSGAEFYQPSTASYTSIVFSNPNGGVGSIATNGSATFYNTFSDYRLKNTVTPMTGALAKVAALKPVTYKWNVDGSDGQGFIAHELQEIIDGCVTGEKDAVDADGNPVYQGIDTSFLVATLTAAIKEQQALIQSLTDRLTALEGAAK